MPQKSAKHHLITMRNRWEWFTHRRRWTLSVGWDLTQRFADYRQRPLRRKEGAWNVIGKVWEVLISKFVPEVLLHVPRMHVSRKSPKQNRVILSSFGTNNILLRLLVLKHEITNFVIIKMDIDFGWTRISRDMCNKISGGYALQARSSLEYVCAWDMATNCFCWFRSLTSTSRAG